MIFYLLLRGYKIIKHRYQGNFGEIDIIAKRLNVVAFIEVKARNSKDIDHQILSVNQQKRIKKSALFFINSHPRLQNINYRYDLATVNKNFKINYYKGFFDWY